MAIQTFSDREKTRRKIVAEQREQRTKAELVTLISEKRKLENEILKREIIENDRIDLLATEVLNYFLFPFHKKIMKFQYKRKKSLTLAPRDSGKSTICDYTKVIHSILKNPNIRIALVSNTQTQAEGFLKEIKNHLESNKRLIEIFGEQVGKKWDAKQILVKDRNSSHKDPTVTCIGVGSALIGKHFDMLIMDDGVTEESSRTALQRERQRVWFYQSLYPTLEPEAEIHIIGTRYNFRDLYAHLMGLTDDEGAGEFKNDYIRIRAIEEVEDPSAPNGLREVSYYPEKHTVEYLQQLRENMGVILFNAQYQNDTELMKGAMIKYEYFRFYEELPRNIRAYQGVDLAISEKDQADKFAHVTIGIDEMKNVYLIDFFERKSLRPKAQTKAIVDRFHSREDILFVGIESNAYQEAKAMDVVDEDPTVMVKKVYSKLDKKTKGWKIASIFEVGKVFIHNKNHQKFMDHMLLFTGERGGSDDLFDAFYHAVSIGLWKKSKKVRKKEFGLL